MLTPHTQAKPYGVGYVPHTEPHDDEYDDTLMSKEEYFAKLDSELQAIKEGKGIVLRTKEDSRNYLMNL
ncbi:MAG: hypothetical protein LBL94_03270 [Prevotellaceae bacterium]|jgi:hypothetical protein|nr:hypothetical protein [Prevotellaceae bacterium]